MDKHKLSEGFFSLSQLVERLRGKNGCPWDALQTDTTIMMYLLEEAYEVLNAIEKKSPEDVCQELGDLLFQILFLAYLAEERGEFSILEVIEGITTKMINRHPHVFGNKEVHSPAEVSDNWAKIKRLEKGAFQRMSSSLNDVPIDLPALLRAHRLIERASRAGIETESNDEILENTKIKFRKLEDDIHKGKKEKIGAHIRDLIFCLIKLARVTDHNAEHLIREANRTFLEDFEKMEADIEARGIKITEASSDLINKIWDSIRNKAE